MKGLSCQLPGLQVSQNEVEFSLKNHNCRAETVFSEWFLYKAPKNCTSECECSAPFPSVVLNKQTESIYLIAL